MWSPVAQMFVLEGVQVLEDVDAKVLFLNYTLALALDTGKLCQHTDCSHVPPRTVKGITKPFLFQLGLAELLEHRGVNVQTRSIEGRHKRSAIGRLV